MGIDIYARWKGMTTEERETQITGFSVMHGHTGYLREAYHGEPYATRALVPEAFESEDSRARIPASILKSRLLKVVELARERNTKLYDGDLQEKVVKSFVDFVALCERKEMETGEPCEIYASY